MRCGQCGQEMPVLKPGTMVESHAFGIHRTGVIPSEAVTAVLDTTGSWSHLPNQVGFIDINGGRYCVRERKDVTVVHGYMHITR